MSPPLPLWQNFQDILQRLVIHDWCALICDYEGLLTPAVDDPATAPLHPVMRQVLLVLLHHPHYRVAIVSGRPLARLQESVQELGTTELYLAGNHGLEIVGPRTIYLDQQAMLLQPQLRSIAQALSRALAGIPGVRVEDNGLILTLHLREVPASYAPVVQRRVLDLVHPALEARSLVLRAGRAVLEIRPRVEWDKGEAVRWIVEHMQSKRPGSHGLTIYIGDDVTNEDAFNVLDTTDLGIVVGTNRQDSLAHYCVETVGQAAQFLAVLSAMTWSTAQV